MNRDKLRVLKLVARGIATDEQFASLTESEALLARQAFPQHRVCAYDPQREADYTIRFVLSDEQPNRYGDIVRQDGWDLRAFSANPIALWGHDHERPGIGQWHGLRVDVLGGGKVLTGGLRFAVDASEDAAKLYKLAAAGVIRAVSPGFANKKLRKPANEDERSRLGLGRHGVELIENELHEGSLVNVGAQPAALKMSVESGLIDADYAERLARQANETERDLLRHQDELTAELAVARYHELRGDMGTLRDDVLARLEALDRTVRALAIVRREEQAIAQAPAYMAHLDRLVESTRSAQ